tara:strand:- start:24026 stop:25714 length:1689 start_codon:yes stop_codon:yes gene_type:complete
MNSIEYQRYTLQHLIDRLGPSTWVNTALAVIVFAITLITSSLSFPHILVYTLFVILFALRVRFYKKSYHRAYPTLSHQQLKQDLNYFSLLVGTTGFCWAIIIGLPAFLRIDSNFWNPFVYFLASGLIASSLFNIGISKRDFFFYCTPILVSLSLSSVVTQNSVSGRIIFLLVGVLFFFFITVLRSKTALFYSEIYNRQQDLIQILEGFPGAISLVQNGRYLYRNQKLISLMGDTSLNINNDSLGLHHINQALIDRIKLFEVSIRSDEEFETDLMTSSGQKTFWVVLKKLHENKIMILSLDIDEKRSNERKIAEQNIKLIESSKMASLGEMSSGIAHEINNPLTIIQGSTRQLSRLGPSLPENIRSDVDRLTSKIDLMTIRITKIIKGLRSFAREGSHDPFDYVSAKQIIDETLFICESRFKNSNIDVKKNYNTDAFILCRAVQISQVLLNILNNAYDAIVEKRNLYQNAEYHSVDFIEINTLVTNQQFTIVITDTGKGIEKESQEKILNPFFTTKSVGKGTGLGLSISKSIMEEHQGTLKFNFDAPQTQVNLIFNKFTPPPS